MSTVVSKSLEEDAALTAENVKLSRTNVENVTVSTTCAGSEISCSTVKADADSSLKESGQNKKDLEKLQATENGEECDVELEHTDALKAAPQSRAAAAAAAGTELFVQLSDDSSKWKKSKQTSSEESGKQADHLRKAHVAQLATGNSISADSYHGSRLSVRSEVSQESVDSVSAGAEIRADDDVAASRTSLSSQRSHAQCKKTKNKTDVNEGNGQAASLVSVRSDESQIATENKTTAANISASRTSLRSLKPHRKSHTENSEAGTAADIAASRTSLRPHTVHIATKSKTDRSEGDRVVVSVTTLQSGELLEENDKSLLLALSRNRNVGAQLSVTPNSNIASNKGLGDVEADSSAVGSRSRTKSPHSAESSESSSVIISRPPKHVAVNNVVKDAQPAAEAKAAKTSCTTGDSVSFYCIFVREFAVWTYVSRLLRSYRVADVDAVFK